MVEDIQEITDYSIHISKKPFLTQTKGLFYAIISLIFE